MTQALALPTRKSEDFRYSDIDALAQVWPVPSEDICLRDGEEGSLVVVELGAGPVARRISVTLGAGARFDLRILHGSATFGRIEVSCLLADKADFTLGAAQLGSGTATVEIVSTVTHQGQNATSRQIVRSVLVGHATGTCLGKVAVAKGAVGTDAEQSVRAMLLDRTATANAKPELEIYADDVKCAHGCAVGERDAMGLFYLQSRGLTPPQAKALMLQAFLAEAFAGAEEEERLQALALERLGAML